MVISADQKDMKTAWKITLGFGAASLVAGAMFFFQNSEEVTPTPHAMTEPIETPALEAMIPAPTEEPTVVQGAAPMPEIAGEPINPPAAPVKANELSKAEPKDKPPKATKLQAAPVAVDPNVDVEGAIALSMDRLDRWNEPLKDFDRRRSIELLEQLVPEETITKMFERERAILDSAAALDKSGREPAEVRNRLQRLIEEHADWMRANIRAGQ